MPNQGAIGAHDTVRVGCGAGFSGDRLDAPLPVVRSLIASGGPAAIMFETLGERTLALAQLARLENPDHGYEPLLERMLEPILEPCLAHGIRILGNFGQANPRAAARAIRALGKRLGCRPMRIAVVTGDDLVASGAVSGLEDGHGTPLPLGNVICANAYLGAAPLVEALAAGADVVVTGRVADPSLALAPFAHFHGWSLDDPMMAAAGTAAGHLLECGAQVTGGYYADPGFKDVPHPERIAYPVVAMQADGRFVVGKGDDIGGLVNRHTVTEQLLYEIHDPSSYLTPDVTLDITEVALSEIGSDQVRVEGARGREKPRTLKVTVGHEAGWFGEAEISYAGPNALDRARLALDVVRKRLPSDIRMRGDLIGVASVFNDDDGAWLAARGGDATLSRRGDAGAAAGAASRLLQDVRLRIAISAPDRATAARAPEEVLALYCAGPAGGGGIRSSLRRRISTTSGYIRRELVRHTVEFVE
ncbi:acyclic terpene utilization AtuA family protein [Zeimonas arvi]|uniref:acyclic terpene utilization AtuA family protein n=1 Tax=Zeimonas arvi TaxID=2498847 RepID=UPI001CEDB15A|nr:acyclic terpene utilization AtuA family protein [Zeimonas arvi]